jgi:hypothetical protein
MVIRRSLAALHRTVELPLPGAGNDSHATAPANALESGLVGRNLVAQR